jgi:hypothetical protein
VILCSARSPKFGVDEEGVTSPEHFLTPTQFPSLGQEDDNGNDGGEGGDDGEGAGDIEQFHTPTAVRRFPSATLDTAFMTVGESTIADDDGTTMMMTVTPINDYMEDEDEDGIL